MPFRKYISQLSPSVWLVLVAALALRIIYLLTYSGLPEAVQLTVDANFHHHWAQHIANGNLLGDTTFFRAPLYIYVLAFIYLIFGASLWVGRILGLLIGVVSVGMTYVIGRRLFDHRAGLLAMILHAIYPMTLYFEPELLVDPLFLLLAQVAIDRLVAWHQNGDHRTAFWFAVAAGLASITRPTGLLLFAAALMLLITQRRELRRPVLHIAAVILGAVITIGPVTLRNIAIADDPTLIASSGGINLYIGNNDEADGVSAVLPPPLGPNWRLAQVKHVAEDAAGEELTWGEVSSYWTGRTIDWILHNPGNFLQLYASKLYWYVSSDLISNNRELPQFFDRVALLGMNPIRFWLILPLAVIGIIAGGWRTRAVRPVLLFTVLYILVGALFFYATRFRYPLLPIFFVLAGYGLVRLWEVRKSHQQKFIGMILTGTAVGIFSAVSIAPLPEEGSTHALSERGIYEYSRGNFDAAVQYQRAALAVDPDFPGLHSNLGATFLELRQLDSASYHFRKELELHPWHNGALSNLAYTHLVQANYATARSIAEQAVERAPYDYNPNIILFRSYYADSTTADSRVALTALEAARRTDNYIFLLNDMAELLLERGLIDQAEDLFERAIDADGPPIETDDQAFRHNFRHSERMIMAQRARAAIQLSYISGMRNNVERALQYARRAVEYDASMVGGWINLHHAYQSLGQTARAAEVLQEAARRFPNDPTIRQLMGR